MSLATAPFPDIDARQQSAITDEQAAFFLDHGLLLIRNVLGDDELRALREQTWPLIERASREHVDDPDYLYGVHEITGDMVPHRIEYLIDKSQAARALLGHPFILRSVQKLQGPSFIPTWDSLVFKIEGGGRAVPWHRDAGDACVLDRPIFNVDFYLDGSDISNCLWGIFGSSRWSQEQTEAKIRQLNDGGFHGDGDCVSIPVNPGDVLLHNILTLHGSPPARTGLRRTVYYEFRPIETELARGPHTPEYISAKQKVLLACLRDRQRTPYAADEEPFRYRPAPQFAPPPFDENERLETYRIPHERYWREEVSPSG